ncbi:MAG: glycine cleavage system aminomethyltransferase GcvT [Gammaproteobacteria bacterium]|nr:glycine cleavage system aminomethyltransferase GcvT [Gammaproteobacteria bacterium]NNC97135.1 glycine cleavage system aminomethyltransferase GcvT [Gammaproteobacteria bacterium]NNM13623.1 glycine cleavage system aminomethyltransferase GcvT [Gammaproteobacteria bacterium]
MGLKTPLYDVHVAADAKIVDFGGWDMPLHYGSQMDEHHFVRQHAGMFDVSHMTVVDLHGERTKEFLQYLLANDVAKLKTKGKALYSCMLNEAGGVIDDLICYYLQDDFYRLVVNASTRDKDIAWISKQAQDFEVLLIERDEAAMIAVQGPQSRALAVDCLTKLFDLDKEKILAMSPFNGLDEDELFIARTGYTGEDGFEIVLDPDKAIELWNLLVDADVHPCGLGARDTLRLEAGMNLYGNDMTEATSPLISALSWTIAFEPETRDFIGRAPLVKQKAEGINEKLVGLLLEGRGVMRSHQRVVTEFGDGEITSGGFSPTLQRSIAYARIPKPAKGVCQVEIRNKLIDAKIGKLSFVRHGKPVIDI